MSRAKAAAVVALFLGWLLMLVCCLLEIAWQCGLYAWEITRDAWDTCRTLYREAWRTLRR